MLYKLFAMRNKRGRLLLLGMPVAPEGMELAIGSQKVLLAVVPVGLLGLTVADPIPRGILSPDSRTTHGKIPSKSSLQSAPHNQMP